MYNELVKDLREVADEVDSDYDVDPYNAEQRCLVILQAAQRKTWREKNNMIKIKEHEKCTAALTNEELLKDLKYCGCDPYYMGWWEETCKEIADRLFVEWEKI